MNIAATTAKMIAFYRGNHHDINHFLKVHAYARTIGELEGLDPATQRTLELAAVIHDIACPLCREKYGSADGRKQELESPALVEAFLADLDVPEETARRVNFLVSHHHTYTGVDGPDYQILLEADYLVNADEGKQSPAAIRAARNRFFRTAAGTALLNSIYFPEESNA